MSQAPSLPAPEGVSASPLRHEQPRSPVRLVALLRALTIPLVGAAALAFGYAIERAEGPEPLRLSAYAIVFAVCGLQPLVAGLRQLLALRLDVDFLMIVAAIGAAIVGDIAEGGLLLVLFATGHALESHAMGQARNAIRELGHIAPKIARRHGADGREESVPVDALVVGDLVAVRPGERLPADGRVVDGASDVDQSPITGESMPVAKEIGSPVFAGTLNGDGALLVRVEKLASESTMARMARLVAEAEAQKAPTQRVAERFTRVYVPIVVLATIAMATLPPLLGWLEAPEAFLRAMTLLVGASPCALALSTPAAILAGVARGARAGVLIKGGASLERLGTVVAVAMDKTGTITRGRPEVVDVVPIAGDERELLRVAASVEAQSDHPLAKAIVAAARARGIEPSPVRDIEQRKGSGIAATLDGRSVLVVSPKACDGRRAPLADAALRAAAERLEAAARTVAVVIADGRFLGALGLLDRPRDEAHEAFALLRRRGVRAVAMLTGDNRAVAATIGREVGVDRIEAGLLPEEKIEAVHRLERELGPVAMVGDGVNDAPALAAASVGIAMGVGGTDVALEAADVALMRDDLRSLAFAIGLSRATRTTIRINIAIAMGVVALLIVLAALGLVPMPIAVVMHEGSTVAVVLIALTLLRYRG